ncbi:hypothetical protein K1719_007326 [Acacia pycnantha]|nr:hypothetical protein K1719_007326 [Acacia pycnantha]
MSYSVYWTVSFKRYENSLEVIMKRLKTVIFERFVTLRVVNLINKRGKGTSPTTLEKGQKELEMPMMIK